MGLNCRPIAVLPGPNQPANPLRDVYHDDLDRLTKLAAQKPLDPNDAADLGALHLRFGQMDKAVEVLRAAQRVYPDPFALAANLETAAVSPTGADSSGTGDTQTSPDDAVPGGNGGGNGGNQPSQGSQPGSSG